MRNSNKLVWGIGIKGDKYPSWNGVEMLKEYSLWTNMLLRCTNKVLLKFPTYEGVTCSENFKSYTFFYEWCNQQKGFNEKDKNSRKWSLDKDLLIRGNKCYSEDVCVFVPNRVNNLVIKRNASRGDWPIGVSLDKATSKYKASCRNGSGTVKTIGMYSSVQEAFRAYKSYKESVIKEVANEYKEQLDYRVYEALMNYEVNEND
jgi:hypothetical protein